MPNANPFENIGEINVAKAITVLLSVILIILTIVINVQVLRDLPQENFERYNRWFIILMSSTMLMRLFTDIYGQFLRPG